MIGLQLTLSVWGSTETFVNFETAPVAPIALNPDQKRLAVCNLPDGRLELFDVSSGSLAPLGSVAVGIDPVSVRFRNSTEAWVVNHISDSISVVDLGSLSIKATIQTLDAPADVVFAGSRAFVSCALPNTIQVFEAATRDLVTNIVVQAERPKALAVSADGAKVYAAVFESGNRTTVIGARFRNLLFIDNVVSRTNGPYGGQNPAPNLGSGFEPPLVPGNPPAPKSGLIVKKDEFGRWVDDNNGDWTEFVSGTNAALTQRATGWDLPDRDLAIIDTSDFSVRYATGLMNICMALAVHPANGHIAVVGTDAINEVRFEPNLNGVFARVKLAVFNSSASTTAISDLNPHLDYATRSGDRERSIGDPRAILWDSSGARGYVAGMGSRNVILVDAEGNRISVPPIEVGEGPCGLALDEMRHRLYVFNRFSCSISVVDTEVGRVIEAVRLLDPTPVNVSAGRRHLYDTRRTSGLGQASCASCHVDAKVDRLGWDLGNPAGETVTAVVNHQGTLATNVYHPMKGVMVTQTLQDIIGKEPFHWRGDRPDIESFNGTFTNLQAAASGLTAAEMRDFRDFLGSIRFPPNPHRHMDNSFSTNLALRGHIALGEDTLPKGAPLPNGNAMAGFLAFHASQNFCVTCHTLPTGLGVDTLPPGTNGGRHFPLAFRLEDSLRSKISQFRNLAEKVGMDGTGTNSRAGFGFGHDGSVDSLTRFLNGVRVVTDRDVADLTAFLMSVSGSDTSSQGGPPDTSPPAGLGRQVTTASTSPLLDSMLVLAHSSTSRVDLVAKHGQRGWFYDRARAVFQSDRHGEASSLTELLSGEEVTFTIVPRGLGARLGVDRDCDGIFDRDDPNPSQAMSPVRILAPSTNIPAGREILLEAQIGALPAPLLQVVWWRDGQAFATNGSVRVSDEGLYAVTVRTEFGEYVSATLRLELVPLIANVNPPTQLARLGAEASFAATVDGIGPVQYEWLFKGETIGSDETLVITNVGLRDEGIYQLVVQNPYGSVTSAPVSLTVLINPAVVIRPISQIVPVGGDATFSFMISGHPPPFGYLLRRSSSVLTSYVSDERLGFLSLFNVQLSNAATYRVVITNAANPSPGLTLDPVALTVVADSDADGLPDSWESQHGGDPSADPDMDQQTNLQEYIAGTDPTDRNSYLKVQAVNASGRAVLQFEMRSNHTYTVQSRKSWDLAPWQKVSDFPALPTNRLTTITNTVEGAESRYYRLVTPRVP